MKDCQASSVLPRFDIDETSLDVPAVDFIEDRISSLSGGGDDGDQDDLLRALAQSPFVLVHVLLSNRFSAWRENAWFLSSVAYLYFLLGHVREAYIICNSMTESGCETVLSIDVLTRCLIEADRQKEAMEFLRERTLLINDDRNHHLRGRLSALYFVDGDIESANNVIRSVREQYEDVVSPPRLVKEQEEAERFLLERDYSKAGNFGKDFTPNAVDAYSKAETLEKVWLQYEDEMKPSFSRYHNSSMYINTALRDSIIDCIHRDPGIGLIVNYGSAYGLLEYELAEAFPDRLVVGYDYSSVATELNANRFVRSNLVYISGNFEDEIAPYSEDGTALMSHVRTATLMSPRELLALYSTANSRGVRYIVGVESVMFGVLSWEYPNYGESDMKSSLLANQMLNHDYTWYLGECGYDITNEKQVVGTYHMHYNTFRTHSAVYRSFQARIR